MHNSPCRSRKLLERQVGPLQGVEKDIEWLPHTIKLCTGPVSSNPYNKNSHHHFVDAENEAQRGQVTFPRTHSSQVAEQNLNSSQLTPKTMHSPLHYPVCENHCSFSVLSLLTAPPDEKTVSINSSPHVNCLLMRTC